MPPLFSKPLAQLVEVETENAETQTGPCLPLDLSDIINNEVGELQIKF